MIISVVVPLFNKEKYICRTITSVLNQTHKDFELLIINDGSSDNSVDVVKSFNDKRIRLINQKNGGVSKARNNGVMHSKSDWVAFLDADDEYEQDFLYEMNKFLTINHNKNLSFIGSNYFIGSKERIAVSHVIRNGIYDYFSLFRNQTSPNNSSTTVVNKSAFLKIGGFPEGVKQFEDWITWFKLAFAGEFGYISRPLAVYHYVENSVANTKRDAGDFYNDAILVPIVLLDYCNRYRLSSVRKNNVLDTISEFSVNIAIYLIMAGSRKLAIRILRYSNFRSIILNTKILYTRLLAHFLIPQSFKNRGMKTKVKKYLRKLYL